MRYVILSMFFAFIFLGCASTASSNSKVADDYGFSENNPIKVGGFLNGPSEEREYLNSLTGLNGEPISFVRQGSCCPFETKNSPFGGGMLDVYEVKIQGDTVKKIFYINMYDKDKLYAPKGFKMKN